VKTDQSKETLFFAKMLSICLSPCHIFFVEMTIFADNAYQFAPDPKKRPLFQIEQSTTFNDSNFNLKAVQNENQA